MKDEHDTPSPPTCTERLDAMEFVLGQMALLIEADHFAMRAQLYRLQAAIHKAAPGALIPPGEEEGCEPFTVAALSDWVQGCVERMAAHQAATVRHRAAIAAAAHRLAGLGEDMETPVPPEIAAVARAAVETARRPRPRA